ncbi:hypothetical protein ARMGADRAFT_1093555 [Armillaria gallica]|uniref:Uncharacterized protein n=1 Tax=Armillaria gallica TaxID=47427 RepID=A0A2H3CIH9_ARMGA|nr:hypothetical protein ARMGADRAFT_1093555 [Armillaria gallica]
MTHFFSPFPALMTTIDPRQRYSSPTMALTVSFSLKSVSTDFQHSQFASANQPRKEGGLGPDFKLPPHRRPKHVYLPQLRRPLRGGQITVKDLPVNRSVDETIRLIKVFQIRQTRRNLPPTPPGNWRKEMKADSKGFKEYFSAMVGDEHARQAQMLSWQQQEEDPDRPSPPLDAFSCVLQSTFL